MFLRNKNRFHSSSAKLTNQMMLMPIPLLVFAYGIITEILRVRFHVERLPLWFCPLSLFVFVTHPYLFFYRNKVFIFSRSYFRIGNCLGMTFSKYRKEDIDKIEWRDRNKARWGRRYIFFNDLLVTFKDGKKVNFDFTMEDFSRFVYAMEAWSGIPIPNKEKELDGRGNEKIKGAAFMFQRRFIEGTWTPKDDEITINE